MKTAQFFITVYLCDRSYGGGEEGGWWYDTGIPLLPEFDQWHGEPYQARVWTFTDETRARRFQERFQRRLDTTLNYERRDISSVLSTGQFHVLIQTETPRPYPQRTPHYE